MSSSSLYGSTGNVTVSANNLTTLYNATTGNVVTQNVPDRDFTTLYTKQTNINPTKQYGNSNVEAFLNAGTDGANTVQNIIMTGNITVGGTSDLGPVGNITITGGNSGYVLTTDGTGNLIWAEGGGGGDAIPYIHFDVSSTSNNQTFTNSDIEFYSDANSMAVMKNGINIEPSLYEKSGNVLTVNILLNTGDTIDILPSGGGASGLPGGLPNTVQYNNGYDFAGDSTFTFNESTNTLTVANVTITGEANLGDVSNITIDGGTSGYVMRTDGAGNLSWVAQATGATVAGSNTQVQFNDDGSFGAVSSFTFDQTSNTLTVGNIVANGSGLTSLTGANVTGTVANANVSNTANFASYSNIANTSNVSYSVSGSNVIGTVSSATTAGTVTGNTQSAITSVGTLTGLTSTGIINLSATSNVDLGSSANLHIAGGSANYFLKTDGAGNLSWDVVTGGAGSPGGSNTYVQFNDAGAFGGTANLTFDKSSNVLSTYTVNASSITNLVGAVEKAVFAGGVTGSYTYDTSLSSVVLCTTNTTGNFTINLTNLSLNTNDVRSFAFINKNASGSSYHVTGISIGGSAQTVNWSGNTAPTTGTVNDIYNITVIKTSGTPTYSVFVSVGGY